MGGGVGKLISSAVGAIVDFAKSGSFFGNFNPITFAISLVVSAVISKVFAPDVPKGGGNVYSPPDPGQRQQLPPAGNNKLPVVYGTAYVGGIITDMSISSNNQDIYWVIALCEVTNTESGGSPDTISFGNIYWGGKRVVFNANGYSVDSLLDESTGQTQNVAGYMDVWLYRNGSNQPANSSTPATTVLSASGLIYTWNGAKQMSNCAFAIVHLKYSQSRGTVGLSQTRFQVTNSRTLPGDCFYDYLTSARYGAAIDPNLIDTASLTDLNIWSNTTISYVPYTGGLANLTRYKFDGTIDTNQNIMSNLQMMSDCCMCLLKYNELTGQWGVIVQKPTYTVAMDINDSNMVSAISVTPVDVSNSFNVVEVKFPDGSEKDSFASATFDLQNINPSLLFPNEPVNKQSVNLNLVNNSVRAQYIANIMLEQAREDLNVNVEISYVGLQLEAGDIVTVTNDNYGWAAKPFRINRVTQKISETGQVTAALLLNEFNSAVYDDKNVTQFTPAPNTGIGSPTAFGTTYAPIISTTLPNAANPNFQVTAISSSGGIIQYAEIWYSAFTNPSPSQLFFAGTTEIQSNGDPYDVSYPLISVYTSLPPVTLFDIPAGNWYFFTKMVNALGESPFSPASAVLNWRPTTFQFTDRYVAVAYADDASGGGFSLSPTNKFYYGLANQTGTTVSTMPSAYKWYLADPAFGTNIYLAFSNRSNRKFSFDTDFATYAAGSGAFVPQTASKFDIRIWSALDPAGTSPNIIDLDAATGQAIITGTTTVGTGQVKVVNTGNGQLIAALDQFLDFGGAPTLTASAATVTIDIYGRVVGFSTPDDFYFTAEYFTATSGQTVFTPATRGAGYITGQDLIFQNGLLLDTTDYTENSTTFTLNTGATVGDIIACVSMRSVSSGNYYELLNIIVESSATNSIVYEAANPPQQQIIAGDKLTFSNSGTPTQYTVSTVNYATRTITFTTNPTVSVGSAVYRYRAGSSTYPSFSRWTADLTNATNYLPTEWGLHSGFELLFLNGTIVNEQDYDINLSGITNFPATATGKLTIIQYASNNLTTPVGTPANVVAFTSNGVQVYPFTYNPNAFNLYANGALLEPTADYTTATGTYTFVPTIDNSNTILVQQTYASSGAA